MADVERLVLSPAEAAAMLGISPRKLRDLKRAGAIAYVPYGRGGVGYRREDVLACLDASVRRNGPAQAAPKPLARKRAEGRQPAWLREAIAEGRTNPLTGRKYGEAAR